MDSRLYFTDLLFEALEANDVKEVERCLKKDAYVNLYRNNLARSAFDLAYEKNFFDIFRLVTIHRSGHVPGFSLLVKIILDRRYVLTEEEKYKYVDALVTAVPDLVYADQQACVTTVLPVMSAFNRQYFTILERLIKIKQPAGSYHCDTYGHALICVLLNENNKLTPLKQYELASLLLEEGASVWTKRNDDGNSALHIVAECNNRKLATLLFSHEASREIKNKAGQTPMDINRECMEQALHIIHCNKYMNGIYDVIAQAIRQQHPIFSALFFADVMQNILVMAAGGEILNTKNSLVETMKKPNDIHKSCLKTKEEKLIIHFTDNVNRANEKLVYAAKVTKLVNAYREKDRGEKLFSYNYRSAESQQLIESMEENKEAPEKIQAHIDSYFQNLPLEKFASDMLAKSRAVRLLKQYEFVTNEQIESYRQQKLQHRLGV